MAHPAAQNLHIENPKRPTPWTARTRWLLILTAIAVSVTGHLGGILTFGTDYLDLPW